LAAKQLGANVINLDLKTSATKKGESLLDTIRTLEAMNAAMFVVRHEESGSVETIAKNLKTNASVLNAGDGTNAHPTQALLDMMTIRKHKKDFGAIKVAIIGDILHSRVAHSQIHALNTLGTNEVRVIAPEALLPNDIESFGVKTYSDLSSGLKDVDVIITLRVQRERMEEKNLPDETEFYKSFGLTEKTVSHAKPDAIVMHPGPMNRGVEIDSEVADGKQSVIQEQVRNGISLRMAVMSILVENQS